MANFTRPTLPTRGCVFFKRLLSVFLLAPAAVILGAWSFQDGEEKVTIQGNGVPLQTVFKSIKRQTGYIFFYAADFVNDKEKVNVDVKDAKVEEVLQKVLGKEYVWVYNENAVSITKKKLEERSNRALPERDSNVTQITISGAVTDAKGAPIPGATVMVKGTKDGANTDGDGKFSLPSVSPNAVLVISSIGYEKMEIPVKGRTILAKLNVDVNDLDETVVVAYNTTTQRKNVGAVTVVKGEEIQRFPTRSIDRALQGMVPGLQITSGSGLPGGNVANITLRGIATGGMGIARNPLYVVDGTIVTQENFNTPKVDASISLTNVVQPTNPLAQINPNDIESITILKDAAAIALYGSQASNGVILITTKKGKVGKLKVSFQHQTDISSRANDNRDILNQQQYLDLLYESYRNADSARWTDQAIFNDLKNKFPYRVKDGDTSFYPAPNWFNELYSDAAVTVSNDLSLSGGTDIVTHYIGLGYLTQNGVMKNTEFDRYSLRYNVNIKPASWVRLGINSSAAYTHQDFGGFSETMTAPSGFGSYVSPILPVRKDNGEYQLFYAQGAGGSSVPNPVAVMDYDQNKADAYRGIGNIFAEFNFLRYFSFKTNLGADFLVARTTTKTDKRLMEEGTGSLQKLNEIRSTLMVNNLLRYDQTFGTSHALGVILGQEAQIIKSDLTTAMGLGFGAGVSDDDISSATSTFSAGILTKTTFLSYFGQVNYEYRKKYLASVGLRMDGSSRFGKEVPLKKFWSLGAGWILSEESFLKQSLAWLNYLKLRGSIGLAGNTIAIPPSTRSNRVSGIYYSNTPATYGPSIQLTPGNPYVDPESTFNMDLGLEARFWNERINLTADVYKRKTYDLVTSIPQPFTSGQTAIYDNLGDMENKGIELSLSIDIIRNKNFTWNISGNWSTNSNKLVKAYDSVTRVLDFVNKVGENYNSWYLVRWAGVDPTTGSPQWLDADAKTTLTYNSNNRVLVGKPQPDGFGALRTTLRYKNITLNTFLYYAYGFKVYNSYQSRMLNDGRSQPYSNQSIQALDRWQKPGDIASNPKRVLNNSQRGTSQSTRYLADGDYIRLKNVMISYSFSQIHLHCLHIANLEVFIQGNNLALWAKSKDLDPDNTGASGDNQAAYPQQKSFSIGLKVGF